MTLLVASFEADEAHAVGGDASGSWYDASTARVFSMDPSAGEEEDSDDD